ncbi:hypothetical protein Q9Q95_09650 [Sphingomonas sp. DG1-23]|uniref:hypothetical protein n=1 Tax=Sphingomonas sp. DG1-23 TaxID=3068316 RepID=UPI00273F26A1|nr:hypothetical protein [Sphingomonas sp. DG1-23]MDP5279187.1 hypothetical protein [Sphingomonas sp. DG1-23]
MKRLLLIGAVPLVLWPGGVAAQTSHPAFAGGAAQAGPAGRSDIVTSDVDFNLEVAGEEASTSVQIGGYTTKTYATPDARQRTFNWTVMLRAPIGGDSDITARETLDALSNGPELSFTMSLFGFSSAANHLARLEPYMAQADAICAARSLEAGTRAGTSVKDAPQGAAAPLLELLAREAAGEVAPAPDKPVIAAAIDAALEARRNGEDPVAAAEQAARSAAQGRCNAAVQGVVDAAVQGVVDAQWVRRFGPLTRGQINGKLFSPMWRIGVRGGVGVKRFAYVDAATLEERDPVKVPFRAELFGALYPGSGTSALIGSVQYQNGFENAEEGLVCKPVAVDPDADCVTGRPVPAKNIERVNVAVEYRQIIETGWNAGDIAISPKFTYDTLGNAFAAQFPLYFIPRRAGPISPGISATYSSKDDRVRFGAFLKSTFTF